MEPAAPPAPNETLGRMGTLLIVCAAVIAAPTGWRDIAAIDVSLPLLGVPGPWWVVPGASVAAVAALLGPGRLGWPIALIAAAASSLGVIPWVISGASEPPEAAAVGVGIAGAATVIGAGWRGLREGAGGLAIVGSLTAALTALCLVVELGHISRGWFTRQATNSLPDSLIFTDGRALAQAPMAPLTIDWAPTAEVLRLPERSRPAPVDDGEAAIGPPKALVNVVLVVDLDADDAPAWLDLIDLLQHSRRDRARFVVKAAPAAGCAEGVGCASARRHACASALGRGWDLLDLRAQTAGWTAQNTASLAEALGLDGDNFAACVDSKRSGIAADRAAASVRVMKRAGLPWLDVEGFGWTGAPPAPGDVIGLIDGILAAHQGGDTLRPTVRALELRGAPAPAPAAREAQRRGPSTYAAAAEDCAGEGAMLCEGGALQALCSGAAFGVAPRRDPAFRFRLPAACPPRSPPGTPGCTGAAGLFDLGGAPEWVRGPGGDAPHVAERGEACLNVRAAEPSDAELLYRCCSAVPAAHTP